MKNVVTYLTILTQVRDELGAMGEAITDNDLVRTALNGVSKQWDIFVEGIVAREKLSGWERLWDDFVQEETQRAYVHGSSSTGHDEENVTLVANNKKKFKKGPKGGNKPKGEGHATSLGTIQVSVRTKRRNKQQLQQRLRSSLPSLIRSFP